MAEENPLVGLTFGVGRYRIEQHLHGKGMQRLFLGRDRATGGKLLVSYDKLPKQTTVEEFSRATRVEIPGVLQFEIAGRPDDPDFQRYWGVVERAAEGAWLPSILGQHPEEVAADPTPRRLPSYDATTALPNALSLGRSAGRILTDAAAQGSILTRVRPETMWAKRSSDSTLCVTGLSQRSELMFDASYTDSFTWPVFDRYYYAPEVKRGTPTERSLVFCLAIMIAEWATGYFPFVSKDHHNGPLKGEHVPLELPYALAQHLSSAMRLDPNRRPALRTFLDGLQQ